MMRFTPELESTISRAVELASQHQHEYVTLEHFLLAGCEDPEIQDMIEGCSGSIDLLRKKLEKFLKESIGGMRGPTGAPTEIKPILTVAFHRTLQRSVLQVESAGKAIVSTGNVLISMLREEDSHSVFFLEQQGINQFELVRYFSHGLSRFPDENNLEDEATNKKESPPNKDPLADFCTNLNDRAKKGLIDPLIGREEVLERVAQVLSRRTKNNVLLVGDPGVGKTAIADGLALKIFEGKVPKKLEESTVFSLDVGALLSGTKYRGDFEARLKNILKSLQEKRHSLLFVDEIHTLIGAGATSGGSVDASNLLKPALANRSITCIGTTTYKEFRAHLEKDAAFLRRFQKIEVKEPSASEAVLILQGLKSRYEDFHQVSFSDEAIQAIVDLSVRYIHSRPLPDKAIDVLDEVGARLRLKATDDKVIPVKLKDIESVVASISQVPAHSVSQSDKEQLRNLESGLKSVIFGQDLAVEQLCASIKLSRSGLIERQKPIGSYLFTGPTGVGKTELTKQLAKLLGNELIRFDMSEYMEKHSVARLVGAPPGYVGYEEGGLLTEKVAQNPYSVLLLDEMEKAHPDIANVLLQVMDNGKLTDTNGKQVDFTHVILIMTSNVGSREVAKQGMGIVPSKAEKRAEDAVSQAFSPEFINRLDAVVTFSGLSKEVVMQVIEKAVGELKTLLQAKKIELELSPAVREFIFEKGFDPRFGARPIARAVDEHLKKPLVDLLLFDQLNEQEKVAVDIVKGKISISPVKKGS